MTFRFRSNILVFVAVFAVLMFTSVLRAQAPDSARWRIYFSETDSALKKTVKAAFGFHPQATIGPSVDNFIMSGFTDHWYEADVADMKELDIPPGPPGQDMRIQNVRLALPFNGSPFANIHPYTGTTQVDTFWVKFKGDATDVYDHTQILRWPSPSVLSTYADSMVLVDRTSPSVTGTYVRINMLKDSLFTFRGNDWLDTNFVQLVDPANNGFYVFIYHPKVGAPPPATISLTSPPNGSTGRPLNDLLKWTSIPSGYAYKVQVSTNRTFSSFFFRDSLAASQDTLPALTPLQWYFWRVLGFNKFGVSYYQSPPDSFQAVLLPPVAPPIVAPLTGATNVANSPTLKWRNALYAPATYQVQVSESSNFAVVFKDTTMSDTAYTFSTPLVDCHLYYWRVRATNASGPGPFTATLNFKVHYAMPPVPTLIQLADGAMGVPVSQLFTWSGKNVCAESFRIQVSTDSTFATNVLANTVVTDTSATISGFVGLTVYFWRVRSENGALQSAYTPVRTFTTALLPPVAPLLVSPANFANLITQNPRLTWNPSGNNPATYHLQVDTTSSFSNVLVNDSHLFVNDSTLTDTSKTLALFGCQTYFWRVRAKNAAGISTFSLTRQFRTPKMKPETPVLLTPANGSLNLPTSSLLLTWKPVGICAATKYVVHLTKDTTFATVTFRDTVTTTSKQYTLLSKNTKYVWRVYALNDSGISISSDTFHFATTAIGKPEAPKLLFPADGQGGISLTPVLQWDTTVDAKTWRLQVAYDTGFTLIAFNDSTLTQPQKQLPQLLNDTLYYWHVNARNDSGTSAYSVRRRFRTLSPPPAPVLIQPFNGAVNVDIVPTFIWTQPTGAVTYNLQVSRDSAFTNFVFNDTTLTLTTWAVPLKDFRKYYWHVRAKNGAGWGPYSSQYTLTTTHIGPANWVVPLAINETGPQHDTLYFGINPAATYGIDVAIGEFELPPMPPFGYFDARFVSSPTRPNTIGEGLRIDFLPFVNYAHVDTFKVRFQPGFGIYPMLLSWSASFIKAICDSMVVVDEFGGTIVHKHMEIDSSVSITNSALSSVLIIIYNPIPITDVKPISHREIPKGFVLSQNYPNPFNPTTQIQFSTDHTAVIQLSVYDVLGREITRLVSSQFNPGQYSVTWDGSDAEGAQVPSGIYYVRMIGTSISGAPGDAERYVSTKKMIMLK
jgi:hypothetical protein